MIVEPSSETEEASRTRSRRPYVRIGLGVLGLVSLLLLVMRYDIARVGVVLASTRPSAVLLVLLFPLALAVDALAWRRLLVRLGEHVPFGVTWLTRFASEAVGNAVPMAGLASEAVGPLLLSARSSVSLPNAVASSTAKRWLISRAHAVYIGLGLLLVFATQGTAAKVAVPVMASLAVSCALLVLSIGVQGIASRGAAASFTLRALGRLPWLRRVLEPKASGFAATDTALQTLGRSLSVDAWALLVLAWAIEGTQTYVLLRAVGIDVSWPGALVVDGVVSTLRSAAAFVPSGLGVEDVGFAHVLEGAAGPQIGAFLLLKRGKELAFIGLGLATYFFLQRRDGRAALGAPLAKDSLA